MPPSSKIPRIWKRIEITVDDPITFHEWASDGAGGNLDDLKVSTLMNKDNEEINAQLRKIFRKFTDQLMATLEMRGAP